MTLEEVELELTRACEDLLWRERQDGIERMLSCLSWWLDVKDRHQAATIVSGVATEFRFNREATDLLEHLLRETDCLSVQELLDRWALIEAAEAKKDQE